MVSHYSVMGECRNLIVELLPLSVLGSGECAQFPCVVSVQLCKEHSAIVTLDNFSIWMVREGMNPPIYARFYEIYLEVYCPLFFFSFLLAYASVFLCAIKVTDLQCGHYKQQLHKHLLQD